MVTLEGVLLPDVLIDKEFERPTVKSIVEFSLGGNPIIWEQPLIAKPLTLIGGQDFAWIKRSVLKEIYALATVPGSVYSLDYNGTIYKVRFMNESTPVISAEPIVGRVNNDDEDYYHSLTIKLMELQ